MGFLLLRIFPAVLVLSLFFPAINRHLSWDSSVPMSNWRNVVTVIRNDPRFQDIPHTVEYKVVLKEILEKILARKNTEEWIETLNRAGVVCGPIFTIDQVFQDKQILHQAMLLTVDHSKAGRIKIMGFPVKLSRAPCKISFPPPLLGQHTREILTELDYSQEEIEELKQESII